MIKSIPLKQFVLTKIEKKTGLYETTPKKYEQL